MTHPHLVVEVKALFATLRKVFPKLRRRKTLEVILSFDGEQFNVDFQGAQYGAKAAGEWKGTARLSLAMFEAIVNTHQGDTLTVEYRDGKLTLGSMSVTARWQDISGQLLELNIDTSDEDFLAICLSVPESRVVASGLGPRFEAAKRQLAKRIDEAAERLKPFGDYRDPIESLVVTALRKRGASGP